MSAYFYTGWGENQLYRMPGPSVWGSRLWNIIHRIGFYSGKSPERLKVDELRELQWLVRHLETIIPCAECRNHCEEYKRGREQINCKDAAVWFWNFHESVNHRLGKASVEFTEQIGAPCGKSLRDLWKEYVNISGISGKPATEFARHLFLWKSFVGI